MKILSEKVIKELKGHFESLKGTLNLKVFTQDFECQFCKETKELILEVGKISDKINVETFDFVKDKSEAEKYGVDKIPATVVMGETDYGIKFYGIPGGYEFASLIEAIKVVSAGETKLKPETKKFLDTLTKDIHLQVFVTPTCPYCPQAVVMAHHMAFHSPKVKADMIEATEFPQLTHKYNVMGVPRTIINETEFQEGAASEDIIIQKIKKVL